MISNRTIGNIVRILRKETKRLKTPSVTLVGKKWGSPFSVLISCILSLRTKDEVTLSASEKLFRIASDPQQMVRLSRQRIQEIIYPVGFYKTKALRIKEMSRDIIDRFGGKVPDDIDTLLTLKGVGRKTANLVVTEAFGKPGICVDTHVHRISNRLGYVRTKTPEETEWALRKRLPKNFWIEYNALLVTWGQNICRPVSPLCSRCAINRFCLKVGVDLSR
ncbi:MAG TPA: endonuclease III [Candidatus Omnitrophota bacterium]|nr:endonuclease III [Candidatus Omnitrophota bacterium]HPD84466.1 endonuclease III [Candidatus Omnitrophota bacterium]HRZ03324.1 endonuclease III [Candidatus Omnitrophota bacterium]